MWFVVVVVVWTPWFVVSAKFCGCGLDFLVVCVVVVFEKIVVVVVVLTKTTNHRRGCES